MASLLGIFYFFYFSVVGVYIIFMPKVLAMSGYNGVEIGIIFAASPLVRFFLPFAFMKGFKLDTHIFNVALLVLIGSAIAFYLSIENFYTLLLSNIGLGIGLGLVLPYMEVVTLNEIGKENYGKIRLFGSVGFVLVALVLVKFLSSGDIALNYLLTLSILTATISFFIARNTVEVSKEEQTHLQSNPILQDWKLWMGLTLMQVSFGSFYNFFTIYETAHGISLDMTIYLWSFGVLCEIVMLYYQGRFLQNNLLSILQLTTFLSAFRWFLLFMFPQNLALLFLSQSLHAFSFALFHTAAISYLHKMYKDKTLAQQLFSGITYGLGGLSGALLAGYIYEYFTGYLFLSSTLLASMSFGFLVLWSKDKNSQGRTL
jgi:PPP family 3-phenylpropionic acid transporter